MNRNRAIADFEEGAMSDPPVHRDRPPGQLGFVVPLAQRDGELAVDRIHDEGVAIDHQVEPCGPAGQTDMTIELVDGEGARAQVSLKAVREQGTMSAACWESSHGP